MLGRLAALIVRLYQVTLGRLVPKSCRFTPSCSEFAVQAFRENGLLRGGAQIVWRLMRCQPFARGGVDEVPHTGPIVHLRMRAERG